jgi:hypothetical protein
MKKNVSRKMQFSTSVLMLSLFLPSAFADQSNMPKFKTLKDITDYRQGLSDGAQASFEALASGKISGGAKSMQNFCKSSIRFKFTWSSARKQGFLSGCNLGN